MKKILLTVLCFCMAGGAIAQSMRYMGKHCNVISLGAVYASPVETNFDKTLDFYNRSLVTSPDGNKGTPFQKETPFVGASLAYISYGNHHESRVRMWYEVGIQGAFRNLSADNAFGDHQNIEQGIYGLKLGVGMLPLQHKRFDLAVVLVLQNGAMVTQANGALFSSPYKFSQTDYFGAISLDLPMYLYFNEHVSLGVRPFVQAQINKVGFGGLEQKMIYGYLTGAEEHTISQFHNYGAQISLNIAFQKKVMPCKLRHRN